MLLCREHSEMEERLISKDCSIISCNNEVEKNQKGVGVILLTPINCMHCFTAVYKNILHNSFT